MKVFVYAPNSEKAKLELLSKVTTILADAVVTKLKSLSLSDRNHEIMDNIIKKSAIKMHMPCKFKKRNCALSGIY